jgi:Uri superfamily endonuclease
MRRVWHVEYMGENRNVCGVFVVKSGRETWKHVGSYIKICVEQIG